MAAKRLITGFSGVVLAPILKDDVTGYSTGAGFAVPYAGTLTKTPKETTSDYYYDDKLYGQFREVLGEDIEARFAELSFEIMDKMGLGSYDEEEETFDFDPAFKRTRYSLRFVANTLDNLPYYVKYRVFELNGAGYDSFTTRGSNVTATEVSVKGVVSRPAMASVKYLTYMRLKEDGSNLADCEAFLTDPEQIGSPVTP